MTGSELFFRSTQKKGKEAGFHAQPGLARRTSHIIARVLIVFALFVFAGTAFAGSEDTESPGRSAFGHFAAGAATADISPPPEAPWFSSVMLAGYNRSRAEWKPEGYPYVNMPMRGVHDPLSARAVVMTDGTTMLTLVSIDSIGLGKGDIDEIRDDVAPYVGAHVYIISTHSHSSPDVVGLWGLNPYEIPGWYWWEGEDPAPYITFLKERTVEAILTAKAKMRKAFISFGRARTTHNDLIAWNMNERFHFDTHTPGPPWEPQRGRGPQDHEIVVAHIVDRETRGHPSIATIFNYAAHPEAAGNAADPSVALMASSDIAHTARETVEAEHGGISIWLQGALGAMVTSDEETESWEEVDRIGTRLGQRVLEAVAQARREQNPRIRTADRTLNLPLYNPVFYLTIATGLIHNRAATLSHNPEGPILYFGGMPVARNTGLLTTVSLIKVGSMQIACIPGEAYPKIALHMKGQWPHPYDVLPPYWSSQPEGPDPAILTAPYRMVLGLVNDAIGYILYPEDYYDPSRPELPNFWSEYSYESSMSVGPGVGLAVEEAMRECVDEINTK